MGKKENFSLIKDILYIIVISMLGSVGVIFSVLYIQTFDSGFYKEYSEIIISVAVSIVTLLTIFTLAFMRKRKSFIHKLFALSVLVITLISIALYFLEISGFLDKIDSVDKLREYIDSFGNYAVILFIVLQFAQVVFLPLPSFITVGAGVLLFGPLKGAIFSVIGIILGSIVAFYIGKVFGFKVAKWLVGEDSLNKGLKAIKGKDKVVLTFMFLFPFFPDDVLCFVAGITTISSKYFIIMITLVRLITVFISSYSMNNSIIPYDTWWGILLWALFFILTVVLTIVIYKKGDKIEKFFKKRKHKENTKEN